MHRKINLNINQHYGHQLMFKLTRDGKAHLEINLRFFSSAVNLQVLRELPVILVVGYVPNSHFFHSSLTGTLDDSWAQQSQGLKATSSHDRTKYRQQASPYVRPT